MKKLVTLAAAVLALAGISSGVFAGEFDKQLKARQSLMQIYSFNIGLLGAMAKGDVAYKAENAAAAASNLLAAASMKNGPMWPKGSDAGQPGLAGKTRAKPELWSTYPKVAEKGKALVDAAAIMAAAAGNGLDAVRANIGAVGKACKGCHESFRVPKDK